MCVLVLAGEGSGTARPETLKLGSPEPYTRDPKPRSLNALEPKPYKP